MVKRKKPYKTTKKKMSKRDAKKAFDSFGMSYPATKHNKQMMKSTVDDFLNTLRKRDPKTGKVKITRKGKRAIRKARKKRGGKR